MNFDETFIDEIYSNKSNFKIHDSTESTMNQNFSKSKLNEYKNSSKKTYENFKEYKNPNLMSSDRILK